MFPASFSSFPFLFLLYHFLPFFARLNQRFLKFVVDFRTEIGSAVKGLIAFKATKGIINIVTGLGRAFSVLGANIQVAGGAAKAFKAAFASNPIGMIATAVSAGVVIVSEFVGHLNRASESAEELSEKSKELAQSAFEYKQECSDLSEVKKKYEEIYNAVDPDVDKSRALKELQDQLIHQFPELAGKIDLVNGSYDNMCGRLQNVIDKTSEAYRISAEGSWNAAKKKERDFATQLASPDDTDFFGEFFSYIDNYAKDLKTYKLTSEGITFSGSYENRLTDMIDLFNYLSNTFDEAADDSDFMIALSQQIAEVQKLKDELDAAKASYDNLNTPETNPDDYADPFYTLGAWRNKEEAEKAQRRQAKKKADEQRKKEELKAFKEKYDKEKQLADDMYSVGELSEKEYYARLTELRDEYLETQTHDWYTATAKIKSLYEQMTKDNVKAQTSSLSETEAAYKKTLAAIDAEIEKHKRKKSDKEYEQKLADIDDRMNYGRLDDFEKYELEKERKRLREEREEELFTRNAADAKSGVTDAYNAQKTLEKASENTKEYTMALGDYTDALENLSGILKGVAGTFSVKGGSSSVTNLDESTKNQYVNVVLQAVNRSNGQLVDELIKALTSRL